ncbi:hypothetical protein DIPPA_33392 [Diplonema papillatum]|nr:hypothetical protein DIPPA_33392 [Diplonema papillatum]
MPYLQCRRCLGRFLSKTGKSEVCYNCRYEIQATIEAVKNVACAACGRGYHSASGKTRKCPMCREAAPPPAPAGCYTKQPTPFRTVEKDLFPAEVRRRPPQQQQQQQQDPTEPRPTRAPPGGLRPVEVAVGARGGARGHGEGRGDRFRREATASLSEKSDDDYTTGSRSFSSSATDASYASFKARRAQASRQPPRQHRSAPAAADDEYTDDDYYTSSYTTDSRSPPRPARREAGNRGTVAPRSHARRPSVVKLGKAATGAKYAKPAGNPGVRGERDCGKKPGKHDRYEDRAGDRRDRQSASHPPYRHHHHHQQQQQQLDASVSNPALPLRTRSHRKDAQRTDGRHAQLAASGGREYWSPRDQNQQQVDRPPGRHAHRPLVRSRSTDERGKPGLRDREHGRRVTRNSSAYRRTARRPSGVQLLGGEEEEEEDEGGVDGGDGRAARNDPSFSTLRGTLRDDLHPIPDEALPLDDPAMSGLPAVYQRALGPPPASRREYDAASYHAVAQPRHPSIPHDKHEHQLARTQSASSSYYCNDSHDAAAGYPRQMLPPEEAYGPVAGDDRGYDGASYSPSRGRHVNINGWDRYIPASPAASGRREQRRAASQARQPPPVPQRYSETFRYHNNNQEICSPRPVWEASADPVGTPEHPQHDSGFGAVPQEFRRL